MQKTLIRMQMMSLMLLGAVSIPAVVDAEIGTLNVFQITQGYNDGPAVPFDLDNLEYFGFDFHNGKMAACWEDNSGTITSTPPAPVPNIVFASVQVNSPWDVVVGPNVVVSKNLAIIQGEPELAIDRRDTNRISIVSQNIIPTIVSTQGDAGCLVVSTTDNGKTWTTNFPLQKNNFQPDSKIPIPLGINNTDVRMKYDFHGNLLMSYLPCFAPSFLAENTSQFPFFMYLCVSTDHGKSFKVVQQFNPQNVVPGAVGIDFDILAVGQDQVCIAGTNFGPPPTFQPFQGLFYIFPINGKGEFGPSRLVMNPNSGYGDGYGSMAFSPSGDLLVAQTNLEITSSQSCSYIFTSFLPKGANAFPAETAFQPFKCVGVGTEAVYPPQPNRKTWTEPKVSYVYNGHHFGRAYMAYLDNPNVMSGSFSACSVTSCFNSNSDTNVYIVYSDDDGKTWSTPFAIPKTSMNTRIMPHLAIDQTTGNIGVAWLDAVNDPANTKVQVFATVIPWNFFD